MAKPVLGVFKALIISITLMIVMDITFNVVDRVTAYNRIEALATTIQTELTRHNSIPDSIRDTFESRLQQIDALSDSIVGISWNIDTPMTPDGYVHQLPAINESNVVDYGESLHLVIRVDYQYRSLVFNRSQADGDSLVTYEVFPVTTSYYTYDVPALRYLK